MKKISLLVLFLAGWAHTAHAQPELLKKDGKPRRVIHTVGIQINELIRQVLNFNNSTTNAAVINPYLLTYSVNRRQGWGGRAGLGYSYRNFTNDDGITRRETDINNVELRVGAEKAFSLTQRWSAGIGADYLYSTDYSNTKTVTRSFDTTTTTIKSDITKHGGGAMGWVRYSLNKHLQFGTEASFYFLSGDQSQRIATTRRNFNIPGQPYTTTVSETPATEIKDGSFRLPVTIYLLLRF